MPRKTKSLFPAPEGLLDAFAATRYPSGIERAAQLELVGTKRDLRGRLRERCPDSPGVYGFVNKLGNLTYVGMSRSLRRRLTTYFASRSGHRKEFRIGRKSTMLYWQPVAHTFLARLRELELIHRFRPQDNVEGQPSRANLGYIVLSAEAAPRFEVKAEVPKKARFLWGPLPIGRRTRTAVDELNRTFRLRDCPSSTRMRFRDERPLIDGNDASACLRADLNTCLAPCVGGCSKLQYARAVGSARRFLNGEETSILETIAAEMQQAVQLQRFEKAARLRDVAEALTRLDNMLRWFHDWMERATFAYELPAMHETFENQAVIIVRGSVADVVPATGKRGIKSVLRQHVSSTVLVKGKAGKRLPELPPEHFEIARFLFAWFRRYPEERSRLHRLVPKRRAA